MLDVLGALIWLLQRLAVQLGPASRSSYRLVWFVERDWRSTNDNVWPQERLVAAGVDA